MDGLLPFHRPILLPPMWHFNGVYPRPLSRREEGTQRSPGLGNPGRPSKRTPRGVLYFTPYHPDPGTDGGRQPLLELRPLTGSLLIHRVLWNPHQSVSFAQSCLTPCNPVDCNPPGGLPQNNSSKSQHNINCTYPSSWVELNLSTKLKHSQNFFPPGLPQWWEFPL